MNYSKEVVYIAKISDSGKDPELKVMLLTDVSGVSWPGVVILEETRDDAELERSAIDKGFELIYCSVISYVGRSRRHGEAIKKAAENYYKSKFPDAKWPICEITHRMTRYTPTEGPDES